MQAYHETRNLRRPAALVRCTLDDDERFARAATDATDQWTASRWPYTTTATLDAAAGELRLSVALASGYRPGAVLLPLVVLAGLLLGAPAWPFLTALWAGAVLTLLPLGPLLVGPLPPTDGLRTVDRSVSRVALAPYAAATLALVGALQGFPPAVAAAPACVLGVVGAGAYLLAGTGRRVTALDLPLSGLLAPLLAATNTVVAAALLRDPASPGLAVALAVAVALVLLGLFGLYCRLALRRFAAARVAPVARRYRAVAAGGYGVLALLLAGTVLLALRAVVGGGVGPGGPLDGVAVPAPATVRAAFGGLPAVVGAAATAAFYALLVAPLAWLAAGWLAHVIRGVEGLALALTRSEPLADERAAVLPVPVRLLPTEQPVVRPVSVPGYWRGVLIGRPVLAALDDDELHAVLAHEAYHLRHRDLTVAGVASLAAVAFGGRNALLAFYDYAAAERAADAHAADAAGPDALVRALRRLEGLRADGAVGVPDARGLARAGDHRSSAAPGSVLRAPYDLFFERVAALRGSD